MDAVEVLKKLVSIDTTVPPGRNYGKVIDYLEPLFKDLGFQTQRVDIPAEQAEGREGRVNLVCHRRADGKKRLIFYAHIDVVPAEGWDAFIPRVENGKIYGRGASDMKGSLAALLAAFDDLKDKTLKFDLSVMITTDEEFSQASQLRYLAQYLQPVAGAYLFNLDSSFGYVSIANLGALHADILVRGKAVHSAMSHLGENAVEQANRLVNALLALKKDVVRRKSIVRTHPDTGLKYMESRLNVNMIHGGLKVNIVPDECVISVDRRLIPEENMDDALKELEKALNSVPGVNWEFASVIRIPSPEPRLDPLIDELEDVAREITGSGGRFGEMGSGDLPRIVEEWGGKEFGMGVIRPECNIHGRGEFAYIKDIEDLSRIIVRFLSA